MGTCYTGPFVNQERCPVLDLFQQTGAYLKGHFRLTSGLHSSEYLQCALVLQHPPHAERLGQMLAEAIGRLQPDRAVNLVVSPAMGGLIIGHEVARALHSRHLFAERLEGRMTLRRGFTVTAAETAVVVEDVITTGGSSLEVVQLLKERGADVLCAGSIIDRSGGRVDLGVARAALATLDVVSYDPEKCPLCAQGIPVIKPGSRGGA
ncbi:MAG: orotate phosphoribosyltransferase [Acidobacteria bacterium]|nr:orotate phosphoribosyltransferase [Acidobacteriota bacterium]